MNMRFMIPFLALYKITDHAETLSRIRKDDRWVSWRKHNPEQFLAETVRKAPLAGYHTAVTDFAVKLQGGDNFDVIDKDGNRFGTVSLTNEHLLAGALNRQRMGKLTEIINSFPCTFLWQRHRVDSSNIPAMMERTRKGDLTFEFAPDPKFAELPLENDEHEDEGAQAYFSRVHEAARRINETKPASTGEVKPTPSELEKVADKAYVTYIQQDWPNLHIPALGTTPLKAAKDPKKMQELIELLRNMYVKNKIMRGKKGEGLSLDTFRKLLGKLELSEDDVIFKPNAAYALHNPDGSPRTNASPEEHKNRFAHRVQEMVKVGLIRLEGSQNLDDSKIIPTDRFRETYTFILTKGAKNDEPLDTEYPFADAMLLAVKLMVMEAQCIQPSLKTKWTDGLGKGSALDDAIIDYLAILTASGPPDSPITEQLQHRLGISTGDT